MRRNIFISHPTSAPPPLPQVLSGAGSRLVALVNPAWKSVSDFGLFKAGEAREALSEFEVTYSLQSLVVYGYTVSEPVFAASSPSCRFLPQALMVVCGRSRFFFLGMRWVGVFPLCYLHM